MKIVDVLIIGAGAAGLMCGMTAGKRRRNVMILDHANRVGKKILMSGGGRCNFTNLHVRPEHYISHNPHFCKSALSRYTPQDFIEVVKKHHIPFHEKTKGQLFCDNKSQDIVDMLLAECRQASVSINLNTIVEDIKKNDDNIFDIKTNQGHFRCQSLVVASGGLSIPTMGASPFGYQTAERFGIKVWPTRAGLVPLTLHLEDKERLSSLSGVSVDSRLKNKRSCFRDNILFTHRGLSGPAILQISSYWQAGEEITIDMLPALSLVEILKIAKQNTPQKQLNVILQEYFSKNLIDVFLNRDAKKTLQSLSFPDIEMIADKMHHWRLKPNATEGYRTAEVTLGGVDCDALSSQTMEVRKIPGLYFIGEVLDVTGWLGGFNFQWAWASGWAAGQVV